MNEAKQKILSELIYFAKWTDFIVSITDSKGNFVKEFKQPYVLTETGIKYWLN